MTTYSKKYFNEETQQWEPLYSVNFAWRAENARCAKPAEPFLYLSFIF